MSLRDGQVRRSAPCSRGRARALPAPSHESAAGACPDCCPCGMMRASSCRLASSTTACSCALCSAAPELSGGAEVAGKPEGSVRADAASLVYDVCDATARYAEGTSKSVRREAEWLEEFFTKHFAGVGADRLWFACESPQSLRPRSPHGSREAASLPAEMKGEAL